MQMSRRNTDGRWDIECECGWHYVGFTIGTSFVLWTEHHDSMGALG